MSETIHSLADYRTLDEFLRAHHLSPKKRFGQNFLVDEAVLTAIIDAAEIQPTDTIVEIGPGVGTLTRELVKKAAHVTAVEIDADVLLAVRHTTENAQNLTLVHADIRRFAPPTESYKLVANIPYYLTSPILRQFFVETRNRPTLAVLLVQREVAEKICDLVKHSVLAWEVQLFAEPTIMRNVPAKSFLPPPKVESAVIKIRTLPAPRIAENEIAAFFKLLHAGFRAPRKKIGGSLAAGWPYPKDVSKTIFGQTHVNPDLRPEDLTLPDWRQVFEKWRAYETSVVSD